MLNNSFWESASSAIQTFSSTLDKLDRTVGEGGSDDEGVDESDEMVACRTLLEKAQMDIVQMSQQSRVLIAEKEASINMWRQKYLESTGNIEPADMSSLIDMEALLTERNALLANLSSLEEKLREEHAKHSGPQIKAQMYDDLLVKHNKLSEEFSKVVAEEERKNREESETIEHLVSEYTNLGAEFERRQATDAARIQEVEQENEVLTMKLLAMEHSIADFADRASASSLPVAISERGDGSASLVDSKELKTKVVNLQYDIKEKEDEIIRLKSVLANYVSGTETPGQVPDDETEIQGMRAEVSKLSVEKEEAEAIGKAAFEESKKLMKENAELKASLDTALSISSNINENELSRLRDEISVLVNDLDDKVAQCSGYETEIQNLKENLETALNSCKKMKLELDEAHAARESDKKLFAESIAQQKADLIQLDSAKATITELQKQLIAVEDRYKTDTLSSASVSEANILERIERSVQLERTKHQAEIENALNNLRVELEDSCVLMIQQKQDEMTTSFSRNLKDLKDSCEADKQDAIKKLSVESGAQLDTALAVLRQELEGSAAAESETRLANQRAEFELTLERTIVEERLKIDEICANAVQKQKDSDAILLQQACDKVREELAKNLNDNSEEKIATLKAEHENQLALALSEESEKFKKEIANAVQKQAKEDETCKIEAIESLRKDLKEAEEARVNSLRAEFDLTLTNAVEKEQLKAAAELAAAIKNQVDEDNVALLKAIEDIRNELNDAHAKNLAKSLQEASTVAESALEAANTAFEANLVAAISKQLEEDNLEKEIELKALREAHEVELAAALSRADDQLRAAVDAEKEACNIAVEKCIAEWKATVEEKNQAISEAKAELDSMKKDFDEKLLAEIAAITHQKDVEKAREIAEIRMETDVLIAKARAEREEYLTLYTKEYKQRKLIHNKLLEIQGNIRVMCRVRPVLEVERRMAADVDVTEIPNEDTIIIHRDVATKNRYEFDQVFSPSSTQEQVFEAVQPLVISVLDGYNVCIFAYGQTGSGKTFTMEGSSDKLGVSPRAINELFRVIESVAEDWIYTVTFSTLEIYNETIRDLLDATADREKLDVRQTPQGNSVPGLTEVQVTSAAQVMSLMSQGQSNRAVGSHDMNEHSSRSHSILTLVCQGKSLRDGNTTYGKLHLIDLAGSERVGKTDASGDRLKEAQNINRSLSALGDVINALGNKKNSHIPYRNSKLTFLLQDSLGGNSKVMMFVNTSPAVYNLGETVCSLNFAARCRNVELGSAKKQSDNSDSGNSAPLIKSLVKRSSSSTGAGVGSTDTTPASRRSTFGTPSGARK